MKFARMTLDDALGAILAHSVRLDGGALKKGTTLTEIDIERLAAAGHQTVIAVRLEIGDVPEDEAAAIVSNALAGRGIVVGAAATGRANLHARASGLVLIEPATINALNGIDEALTVATLRRHDRVRAGQMVATVKIIPYALRTQSIGIARDMVARYGAIGLARFAKFSAAMVLTRTGVTSAKLLGKREAAVRARIAALGGRLGQVRTCPHDPAAIARELGDLASAGADPILVFGATAIVDNRDVVPAGLELAGGAIHHLGLPVDPGNLLLIGRLGPANVIGVPSCASSIKPNGFDLVLERTVAGLPLDQEAIAAMGHGGLLKEIGSRPQPREAIGRDAPSATGKKIGVGAVVLAAGRSSRMGARNKLLEEIDGVALVRRVVATLLESEARPVIVVVGHESGRVARVLEGLDVSLVHNPDYAQGLSTSLAAGLGALADDVAGALIALADMPGIKAGHIARLIEAFRAHSGGVICVPVRAGRRGNPVLWPRSLFGEMSEVKGDTGARHLIGEYDELVRETEIEADAIFEDIDTPEDLARARVAARNPGSYRPA